MTMMDMTDRLQSVGTGRTWQQRLLLPLALMVIALSAWGVWHPYSYWIDEIFSVAAAQESLPDMLSRWILGDVHPPLYQFALNAWVSLFGSTEAATRSLSLAGAVAAVALTLDLVRRRPELAGFGLLVLVLPWTAYNAQEVRSYVFLYLFALLALRATLLGHERSFCVALVLLAWTHYFGLFLGLSLLFARVVMQRRMSGQELLAALGMLLWLPLHLSFGRLFNHASGGFWIVVDGPEETVANLFSAISPGFEQVARLLPSLSWLYVILLLPVLGYFPWRALRGHVVDALDLQLALALATFVVGIVVVDVFVPMSTKRNFIAVMPLLTFMLFRIGSDLLSRRLLAAAIGLWLGVQLSSAAILMVHKHSEVENYRRATQTMIGLLDRGYTGYYLEACNSGSVYNNAVINNFYLRAFDTKGRQLQALCLDTLPRDSRQVAVLACHQRPFDALVKALPPGYRASPMDAKGLCAVIQGA